MNTRHFLVGAALSFAVMSLAAVVLAAEEPMSAKEASNMITVSDLAVHEGKVTGTVVNKSANPVEDIRVLIRQSWLWQKESRPGARSPGRTVTYTLRERIPPGGSAKFTADTPPLPAAKGGTFKTYAEIAGFSELVPVSSSSRVANQGP